MGARLPAARDKEVDVRKRVVITLLLVSLVLLLLPVAAQAMSFDQAVGKLVKQGWPKQLENHIVNFKGNSLGFRAGGTPSDDACARWIAGQMKAIGLADVKREAVPVDEWDFKGASVTVTGLGYSNPVTYRASAFGGGVGTPKAGVTGSVVYVKDVDLVNGPWSGSAGAFDAVGDVTGKIVVVDFESAMWWMSMPDMEAGLRGAAAVILTYNPDWPGYYGQPDALGAFDAETDLSAPPMVYLSWKDGAVLKDALKTGAVTATVKNDAKLRLIADGGTGYNVVGQIKGTTNRNEYVVFGGHHDAWFKGGLDNASSVVNSLVIAKAMKMSHYKPKRTIVFLSTTAEEYGLTNSWYDWCIGAFDFITAEHPDWTGKIAGMLNTEIVGYKKGNLWMLASPEVTPMLNAQLAASTDLTLTRDGTAPSVIGTPWCWNDQWTFTAAGVPSVSFWSQDNDYTGTYKNTIYHTQYDTPSLIDYGFLGDISRFEFRVAKKFDRGLLPYTLSTRATEMGDALGAKIGADTAGNPIAPTVADVIADNVDTDVYRDFSDAFIHFTNASFRYDDAAGKGTLAVANIPSINAQLMQIEKQVNSTFTALDALDNTSYPFDQITRDIYRMEIGHDALLGGTPDYAAAAATVSTVGLMCYGTNFSEPVFQKVLQQHRPTYYHIAWGGQGHLEWYQNLMPDYAAIEAHNATLAIGLLDDQIAFQQDDLEARIIEMTAVLDDAANQIEDLLPVMAAPAPH